MNVGQYTCRCLIRGYQILVSPTLVALMQSSGWGCRFTPTCSQYALEAITMHGALRGCFLTARRVCRCHPFGGCGHDPVPTTRRT